MAKVKDVLYYVMRNGGLLGVDLPLIIKRQVGDPSEEIVLEDYKDGEGFAFEGRFYMPWRGHWYDATDHPLSPVRGLLNKPGYHLTEIEKHPYGSLGKIKEEVDELMDAHRQDSKVMILVELSDLYGAIEGYLQESFPGVGMEDLSKFSGITKRAFAAGARK